MLTASLAEFERAFLGRKVVGDASMFFCAPGDVISREIHERALVACATLARTV